jgi:hypothetical protein
MRTSRHKSHFTGKTPHKCTSNDLNKQHADATIMKQVIALFSKRYTKNKAAKTAKK